MCLAGGQQLGKRRVTATALRSWSRARWLGSCARGRNFVKGSRGRPRGQSGPGQARSAHCLPESRRAEPPSFHDRSSPFLHFPYPSSSPRPFRRHRHTRSPSRRCLRRRTAGVDELDGGRSSRPPPAPISGGGQPSLTPASGGAQTRATTSSGEICLLYASQRQSNSTEGYFAGVFIISIWLGLGIMII
jgi:hypothetical protein